MKSIRVFVLMLLLGVLVAACQPQTVEVTRVVEVEVAGETVTEQIEVTRVVEGETVTEQIEVTRVVEVEGETMTARGQGGTLTVIYWQAPSNLNPYLSGGTKEIDTSSVVIEPLASYDETGQIVARLVEEIPTVENGGIAEDLTSITWHIKEGILWSDGTPFTAADVVFTANYCMNEDTGCAGVTNFLDVENVEAVDDLTVLITFSVAKPFPYGPFVGAISPVLQEAQFGDCAGAAAQECTDQNFMPIGTGPFVVTEFRPNDAVLYTANENYRDPNKPFFSELFLKGGGDAAAAARAVLETGEADYAWNLQVEPEILSAMELAGNGRVLAAFGPNVERIMINQTNNTIDGDDRSEYLDGGNPHPFLSDPAVTQALSMAINRGVLTQVGYGQAGQPTCNVLPAPAIYVSTANDGCLTQDIAGANALLDEAGIVDTDGDGFREKDGVTLSILYQTSTNGVRQATQALVKQWWAEIGVDTELRNIDASVFFGGDPASPDTYGKFYSDVEMYTNGFSGTDPEIYMSSWACSEISGASNNWLGNNVPRYCNPEYDALVAEMSGTADIATRAELAKQMNDFLVQEFAMIPLIHRGSVSANANSLLGVRMNPWDSELWNIADWTRSSQ